MNEDAFVNNSLESVHLEVTSPPFKSYGCNTLPSNARRRHFIVADSAAVATATAAAVTSAAVVVQRVDGRGYNLAFELRRHGRQDVGRDDGGGAAADGTRCGRLLASVAGFAQTVAGGGVDVAAAQVHARQGPRNGDAAGAVAGAGRRVRLQVVLQVALLAERFGAQRARKWPLAGVGAPVAFQLAFGWKRFAAVLAFENAGMYAQVQREIPSRDEPLVAFVARMRPFRTVACDVRVQSIAPREAATANAAGEVTRRRRFPATRKREKIYDF